jgi:hypothetical protein
MTNLAVTLNIPKTSYYGNDVPSLGGSSDEIICENGQPILTDSFAHLLLEAAAGVASSDITHVFSYPHTQYEGSV